MMLKISAYKIESGQYVINGFSVLRCGNSWQVRDRFGDIEQEFSTLKKCSGYCLQFRTA